MKATPTRVTYWVLKPRILLKLWSKN